MLVLSRRLGEELVIAGSIRIRVLSCRGGQVRLGIEAPPGVRVDRQEIHTLRQEFADPTDPCEIAVAAELEGEPC